MSPPPDLVLLDRDGVIVEPVVDPRTGTHESPLHARDVQLVDGAPDALARLRAQGITLIVVSNQPAAAKGTVSMSELRAVHARTVELLGAAGVELAGWEYCFHHPAAVVAELRGACDCRKPEPGLLRRALSATGAEPGRTWMVGDSDTDVIAGRRVGTQTALLKHPLTAHRRAARSPDHANGGAPDLVVRDLAEFAQLVVSDRELPYSLGPQAAGALENKEGY